MKKSTIIQLAGGMLIAGAGLFIFLRDVDTRQLWKDFLTTPFWAVGCVVVLTLCTLWLRAVRWNLILPLSPSASRKGLFGIVMIGFMINNLLPARLGEAARVFYLWKRNRFTVAESAGSVLLERILDSLVFLSFIFIPALALPQLRDIVPVAIPLAAGAGGVVLIVALYAAFPPVMRSAARVVLGAVPGKWRVKTRTAGGELASNLHWLSSMPKCAAMIGLSVLTVSCHIGMMVVLVNKSDFGVLSGMFASACAALGAAVPLSPGYVGTLHAVLKEGLLRCGVETNKAIAVATLYHAIGYITVTVIGLYYFLKMRISFADIKRAQKEMQSHKQKGNGASAP